LTYWFSHRKRKNNFQVLKYLVFLPHNYKYFCYGIRNKIAPCIGRKAAREFYKRAAEARCSTSKEEAQESFRKSKVFFAKYYNPYQQ